MIKLALLTAIVLFSFSFVVVGSHISSPDSEIIAPSEVLPPDQGGCTTIRVKTALQEQKAQEKQLSSTNCIRIQRIWYNLITGREIK